MGFENTLIPVNSKGLLNLSAISKHDQKKNYISFSYDGQQRNWGYSRYA
jgi:hypothetical protein